MSSATPDLYLGAVDVSGAGVVTNLTGIIASVTRTGTGVYRVVVASGLFSASTAYVAAVKGVTPGGVAIALQSDTELDVLTSGPSGAAADLDFFFGLKPPGDAASDVAPVEVTQAICIVDSVAGAFLTNTGFAPFGSGSVKNGTGDFTLRLLRPATPGNRTFAPALFPISSPNRRIAIEVLSATDLRVRTSTAAPAAVNEDFQLMVGRKTAGWP